MFSAETLYQDWAVASHLPASLGTLMRPRRPSSGLPGAALHLVALVAVAAEWMGGGVKGWRGGGVRAGTYRPSLGLVAPAR